jgi:hypothetical protein
MTVERCAECGFDGSLWTDADAVATITTRPTWWAEAIAGLSGESLDRRPIASMWSIGEYTDHVREVVFGMRFVLDTALTAPGTDLGDPPEAGFDADARVVDVPQSLADFTNEVQVLVQRLEDTPGDAWRSSVTIGGDVVDVHWIARHAVHDVTHHLMDVERLRAALP